MPNQVLEKTDNKTGFFTGAMHAVEEVAKTGVKVERLKEKAAHLVEDGLIDAKRMAKRGLYAAEDDAYKGEFETAVLVTNDSDLLEPMRIVRQELNLPVGLVNPHKNPSFMLRPHATFIKQIREGVPRASQFPNTLTDANGTFHKPLSW
ncbi:MAG: hypothetical protein WBD16_02095 [Pyrinomonadaceae bacterium]